MTLIEKTLNTNIFTRLMFKVNLNITEAEEEVVGEEILKEEFFRPQEVTDLSETALAEKENKSNVEELELEFEEEDFEKKLSVWEDDSLWDDLEEEREVVCDLGNARDAGGDEDGDEEEGGGRVYFPVPELPSLLPPSQPDDEEAPMLDDLPLLSWVEQQQQGGESRDVVESNGLAAEQEAILFVEEDLSLLLGDNFLNFDQILGLDEDGIDQMTKVLENENMNINEVNSNKIENMDPNTTVSKIFDNDVIDFDETENGEVKISDKVTTKVAIADMDLITERENGESSEKEEADEDMAMPENAAVVGEPENEAEGVKGKGETKAEPRSIKNARTLPPASKVVETQDGLVQGVEGKTDEGKIFHKYLGLPYAEPPLGALRCNFNIN